MDDKLNPMRLDNESELAYIYRIAHIRGMIDGLDTWEDVARWLNASLGNAYSESYYRKKVQDFDLMFEELRQGFLEDDYVKMLDQKRDLLYKQQVKTGDKLREYRGGLRNEARVEILIDAVKEAAKSMEPVDLLNRPQVRLIEGTNEATLLIGDWHIGAKFKNFKNEYNVEIAKGRLWALIEDVLKYCRKMGVRRLHVINLGDMIEGHIHVTVRVQSEIDTIAQVMLASELVAHLLLALEQEVPEIVYHTVLDNHSRITPNYKEAIEAESFGRIMHWWIKERLDKHKSKIEFIETEVDDNIGYIEYQNGKKAAFVHGHLDDVNTVFQNLGMLLEESLDYVYVGHHHITKMKEFQGGKVFCNGSLKGMDEFLLKKRSYRRASQTLLVMDGENEIPFIINVDKSGV